MIAALRVSRSRFAWIGLILIVTPLYFMAAAVLKYAFGVGLLFDPLAMFFADPVRLRILNLVLTPLLLFGGSSVALVLNVYAASMTDANPKGRFWNSVLIVLSSSLLIIMTTYGYLENFTHRSGLR
jgi:hypothetical protein